MKRRMIAAIIVFFGVVPAHAECVPPQQDLLSIACPVDGGTSWTHMTPTGTWHNRINDLGAEADAQTPRIRFTSEGAVRLDLRIGADVLRGLDSQHRLQPTAEIVPRISFSAEQEKQMRTHIGTAYRWRILPELVLRAGYGIVRENGVRGRVHGGFTYRHGSLTIAGGWETYSPFDDPMPKIFTGVTGTFFF